jgi:hypothetical protein
LDELEPRQVARARQAPEAGKEDAAAFARAQPTAVAELTKRQERANLAREIIAERQQERDQVRAATGTELRSRPRGGTIGRQ